MNRTEKEKDLWKLLWFDVLIVLVCLMAQAFNWSVVNSVSLKIIAGILPSILIILHAVWTLGPRRGLGFLLLSASLGFIFEGIGLQTGLIFGSYAYHMNTPAIFGVPLLVTLYWAVFIYIGYSITNSFLYWSGRAKPSLRNRRWPLLITLIAVDGFVVTAIDLFMDPLQVKLGSWSWLEGGPYFGVPPQNFVGWFAVTAMVTALYRLFEYYNPRRLAAVSKAVFLILLYSYIALILGFVILSFMLHIPGLAVTGSVLMLAVATLNLSWYEKRMLLRRHKLPDEEAAPKTFQENYS